MNRDFELIDEQDTFDMNNPFAGLDDGAFDREKTRPVKEPMRHECEECGGTGLYRGRRVHQDKAHCFACRGKGYFVTSAADRRKARAKAAQKKIDAYQAFHDANADVIREISAAADWSDFARSLSNQLQERKPWSERQLAAARSMAATLAANRERRAAERKAAEIKVDLSPIIKMFEAASENGYKRPLYRAEGLKISKAPMHGRNAGALYVVRIEDDAYLGKIINGAFQPGLDGKGKTAAPALHAIASDPKAAAIRYGQRTGTCSCCGRTLTKHASIDAGIGPICAEKWGF